MRGPGGGCGGQLGGGEVAAALSENGRGSLGAGGARHVEGLRGGVHGSSIRDEWEGVRFMVGAGRPRRNRGAARPGAVDVESGDSPQARPATASFMAS